MHIRSHNPVNNGKLIENIQYNNMQKKNHTTTILRNQLFVTDVINQNTFEGIIQFQKPKNYNLSLQIKCFIKNSI